MFSFASLASWLINNNIVEHDENAVLRPLWEKRGKGLVILTIAKPTVSAITTTTVESESNRTKLTEYRLTRCNQIQNDTGPTEAITQVGIAIRGEKNPFYKTMNKVSSIYKK